MQPCLADRRMERLLCELEVLKPGERTQYGEYTFQTYDLSHVALNAAGKTAVYMVMVC